MRVRLAVPILDLSGERMKEQGGKDFMTVQSVSVFAVLSAGIDANTDAVEKFNRYQFAQKLTNAGDVDLTIDEIAQIKKYVGQIYAPIVVGRVYDHFESTANEENS